MSYQDEAMKTAIYSDWKYPFIGLAEEAGEVCGIVAKNVRKGLHRESIDKNRIAKELGDVLWMVAACCTEMGLDMETVMEVNLEKLRSRQERNVLEGEGDNR